MLRHLCLNPNSFALWLDTTGTFSADRALRVLGSLQASLPLEDIPLGLPALDRLIVAKAFDLQTVIQAIQSIKASGFPGGQANNADVDEKEDKALLHPDEGNQAMAVDAVVPETAQHAEEHVGDQPMTNAADQPGGPANTHAQAVNPAQEATRQQQDSDETADKPISPTHLCFIVIDSITAIIRPILTAKSPEGKSPFPSSPLFPLNSTLQVTRVWSPSCVSSGT